MKKKNLVYNFGVERQLITAHDNLTLDTFLIHANTSYISFSSINKSNHDIICSVGVPLGIKDSTIIIGTNNPRWNPTVDIRCIDIIARLEELFKDIKLECRDNIVCKVRNFEIHFNSDTIELKTTVDKSTNGCCCECGFNLFQLYGLKSTWDLWLVPRSKIPCTF